MTRLSRPFALDLRSLAAFRVGLGVLVMLDVLMRFTDLTAHYTDAGILPSAPYLEQFANRLHVSLHLANGSSAWSALLFGLMFLAGFALATGYRTRWAAAFAWALMVSTHNRNPMILNGGDVLLRLLLFWAMFLPLNARYSVDHALAKGMTVRENRYFGGPSLAFTLQMLCVYAATAALKTGKEWWPLGTASYYALALDQFTTSFGVWMSQWYDLLRISTYGVFALEVAAPLLLLCPFYFPRVRTVTVLALMGMHLNFDLTMRLGLFPWVDIVALSALLPGEFWDVLGTRLKSAAQMDLKIYYDGGCAFCRKTALLVREFFLAQETQVLPADSDPDVRNVVKVEHSWVVVDGDGNRHIRFAAGIAVLEQIPLLGALFRRLPLRLLTPLGDPCYRLIANNRTSLGKITKVLLPYRELPEPRAGWLMTLLSLFFIGYVCLWNLKTIPRLGITVLPPWDKLAPVLRLDQTWNMFAPFPLKDDGWFVIDGRLTSGASVDLMTGVIGPVSYEKPELVSAQHKNARWRKYMMNIYNKKRRGHRLYLGKYLCRSWNEGKAYGERLKTLELVFMKERTLPYGEPLKIERVSLWRHDCFKRSTTNQATGAQAGGQGEQPAETPAATPTDNLPAPAATEEPVP